MDLSPLSVFLQSLPAMMLVFIRVSSLFMAGPVVGEVNTPPTAKAVLALGVTLILYPLAWAKQPAATSFDLAFIVLAIKEAMVGLSLGFFLTVFFQAARFGGDLLNRYAGFSASENFDPDTGASVSPLGDVMHIALILLFFAGDGHHYFFAALARSYDLIPVGGFVLTPRFHAALIEGVHELSIVAIALSFPVLSAIMALTMAEGVITRAVPQINVLSISFAVKIVVSLLVMYAGMPAAVAFLGTTLAAMQQMGWTVMGTMHG